MEKLLQDIVAIIRPADVWDVFIYGIFFLSLISLAFIPDKNIQPTMLMSAVLLFALVDKVRKAAGAAQALPIEGLDNNGFATLLLHIGMFVFPMMSAGLLRVRGKQGQQARPLLILTGLVAGIYAVGFFLTFNR
jgi:hypothetical protein